MVIKTFKRNRKIQCYIAANNNGYMVATGKPSDKNALCWLYDTLSEAEQTAQEIFEKMAIK